MSSSATVEKEFQSPKAKLKNARRHIASLEAALPSFVSSVSYERIIEPVSLCYGALYERWRLLYGVQCRAASREPTNPPDQEAYVHKIRFNIPQNDDLSAMASDGIQNMRQALDHAVCSCVRLNHRTDKDTYFPLIGAGEDLEAAIKKKARKAPDSIKDVIRSAEPGGGLLYELHQLGIVDKHRLLCNPVRLTAVSRPRAIHASVDGWIAAGFGSEEWDASSHELRYALTGSPDELDYQIEFSVHTGFDAPGVISSKPAVSVLHQLAKAVDRVIGEMEAEMKRLLA